MATGNPKALPYQRSHFVTQLPMDYRYSSLHHWITERANGIYRVGLTKFATRSLGEMVDHGFEVKAGTLVAIGQIIGWVEGFKTISDTYSMVQGEFLGGNPALQEAISRLNQDPYGVGWLYEVKGEPDPQSLEVHAYRDLLDKTIDRLRQQRQTEEGE